MNKKQLTGSLLGLTALFMCGVSSAATIQLTPSTQTVGVGDAFSLTVQGVDFFTGVTSGSIDIQWDPSQLSLTSTESDLTTSLFFNGFSTTFGFNLDAAGGTFDAVIDTGLSSGIAGPAFDVVTLNFIANPPPSVSTLTIDNIGSAGDWQDNSLPLAQPVDVTNVGASVTVVPVPAAVWLFGSGLIGMVGIARRRKTQLV